MKRLPCRFLRAPYGHRAALAAMALSAVTLLSACDSTPRHTNVLMFGTNTKLALDVSQDPATGMGVSLGYKRQEAVWMPLLPNLTKEYVPASCESVDPKGACPKYVGNQGADYDTYSVLASFGFDVSGGGTPPAGVNGGGKVAQFFATGLAARVLAQTGGAALVNTGELPLTPSQKMALGKLQGEVENSRKSILSVMADISDASKIDVARRDALLAKAQKQLSAPGLAAFKAATTRAAMAQALLDFSIDAAELTKFVPA